MTKEPMTLLRQAILHQRKAKLKASSPRGAVIGEEEMELALEWARGSVTFTDVMATLHKTKNATYIFLARSLREFVYSNKL